jgi:hypothetical protein
MTLGVNQSVIGTNAHTYIINSAATLSQNISGNTFTNVNAGTKYYMVTVWLFFQVVPECKQQ